jgi:hypothetical protein
MQVMSNEGAVLREWEHLQQSLYQFALHLSTLHLSKQSRRCIIKEHISQHTKGLACLWWEPYIPGSAARDSQLVEVRYHQIRYGMLELARGYLVSHLMPGIPQRFAQMCALLLYLLESACVIYVELIDDTAGHEYWSNGQNCLNVLQGNGWTAQYYGTSAGAIGGHAYHTYTEVDYSYNGGNYYNTSDSPEQYA